MKPLEELLGRQAAEAAAEAGPEEKALIRFSIGGSVYAVPITVVTEVTEMLPIVRYPERHEGHAGIVNLRGNILPVLIFREQGNAAESRLVVLEFRAGARFCAMVSAPKKVSLERLPGEDEACVVSIDGMPARLLGEGDFPAAAALAEGA